MAEEEENLWFRKIGFYNNPFSIKPAPYDFKIFGQDELLDELIYKVPAGTMSFVEGALGTGKTTVLKHLIHRFKGKGQIIFFSCNRIDSELNVEELLIGKYGFWGRLFKMHPKNMIVLLDEAQELSPENTERIKYFFDQGNIKSVVFTGINYDGVNLHESIKERIGEDGVLKVRSLNDEEVIAFVRNRIGDLNLINDEMIKKLWSLAGKNPRRLLQRCDKACKYVVENGESEFTGEHFKKLFKTTGTTETKTKKLKPKKKSMKKEAVEENPEEDLYPEEGED
ncbi:MAG: AAA family ATPase [Nanoarchaeota archaeon]|nr:AAA family ATPase [Nanoarchaeota archaeon]